MWGNVGVAWVLGGEYTYTLPNSNYRCCEMVHVKQHSNPKKDSRMLNIGRRLRHSVLQQIPDQCPLKLLIHGMLVHAQWLYGLGHGQRGLECRSRAVGGE